MNLFLLRHADAATIAATDDQRVLSTKGHKQANRVAGFCQKNEVRPDLILSSPLPRARQTAKAVASKLDVKLEIVPWLAIECLPEEILRGIDRHTHLESVMLVGHEPDFGLLTTFLLGSASGAVRIRKATLLLLEVSDWRRGGARLEWSLPVKMM